MAAWYCSTVSSTIGGSARAEGSVVTGSAVLGTTNIAQPSNCCGGSPPTGEPVSVSTPASTSGAEIVVIEKSPSWDRRSTVIRGAAAVNPAAAQTASRSAKVWVPDRMSSSTDR